MIKRIFKIAQAELNGLVQKNKFFENYVYKLPSGDVVAIFWDKTEDLAIRLELEKNEEKFRALYEGSQDAIMTISPPDWNFTSANKAAVKMFKAKDEQSFISKEPWNYSPKKQPGGRSSLLGIREMIQKTMRKGANNLEWTYRKLNGEEFVANISLIKIKLGDKYLVQAVVRDLSGKIKQEEEIKEKNELVSKVIDSLPYPFYVIDADNYTIKAANSIARNKMNILKTTKCFEVSHRRSSPCHGNHPCPLDVVKKSKKASIVEHVHFNESGEERLVEVHGYPIFDKSNKVTEMIEYSIDVTDKKRSEEKLKNHLADLEKINNLMVNREIKMIELKEKVKKLSASRKRNNNKLK